jgi:phage gpG-like protein
MRIRDENNVPRFLRVLSDLQSSKIEVGILGEDGAKPSILLIASVHEFGSMKVNIPERSFIRAGFDQNANKIQQKAQLLLEQVLTFRLSPSNFFDVVGEYAVGLIQEYITDLQDPPNKPGTIKAKGSSNPLIDTGRLRQSITHRVVK